jgi:hypothetical protein
MNHNANEIIKLYLLLPAYSLCISVSAFSVLQMYDNKKYPQRKNKGEV